MPADEARIAVLGAGGQLGRALSAELGGRVIPLKHTDADLTDLPAVARTLEALRPAALINAAAYTDVEKAEADSALAFQVNGYAPGFLARWSRRRGIPLVHFSTDYVFPGDGTRPWTEHDQPAPLNVYGCSKLSGERQVLAAGGRTLILRTSWLYDSTGRNFLTTILRLAGERGTLAVVDDQWGAPTYTAHLARAAVDALGQAMSRPVFPGGIYHVCNSGETTWCSFAQAVLDRAESLGYRLAARSVTPITSAGYPSAVRRPSNSRLDSGKLYRTFGIRLPPWQTALAECLGDASVPCRSDG